MATDTQVTTGMGGRRLEAKKMRFYPQIKPVEIADFNHLGLIKQ